MTLATTCPRCKTSFKVVADQLKLRRGMVRCGVCQNVFNGLEHLRYVEALAGSSLVPGQTKPEPVKISVPPIRVPELAHFPAVEPASEALLAPVGKVEPSDSKTIVAAEPLINETTERTTEQKTERPIVERPEKSFTDKEAFPDHLGDFQATENTTLSRSDDEVHTEFFPPERLPAEMLVSHAPTSIQSRYFDEVKDKNDLLVNDADAVDFFSSEDSYGTTHDRASHWFKRALIIGLVLGLVIQLLLLTRNWISVRYPSTTPSLSTLSSIFGLKVEIPRNVAALTIEGFDVQSTGRPDILMVSAILRNRSNHAVQWPAMELTLTGPDRRPILRKVLMPQEYLNQLPTERGVPGSSEHPIRVGLQTESIEAKGFSVIIYYP